MFPQLNLLRSVGQLIAVCALLLGLSTCALAKEVNFSIDVLPLLADRCFHCHGPDESHREADLRLDLESEAKKDLGGRAAVVPGSLEKSELWRRITSKDPAEVMPPPDSHRGQFDVHELANIRQWILGGATWGKHWAFEPPTREALTESKANPIDVFIRRKLEANGQTLSHPAAAHTQARRLAFALTGMAPDHADVEAFVADPTDKSWSKLADKYLKSPHHAERLAMWWLDAARYSDSDGFQHDETRQNWPWRDWVIESFARNKPFDQFTIEQFAGDLMPNATNEQILATCFHRNHMTNGEGGRDPEESRVDYVIDRVNTTGTVWLGLTLGCVQCHSHKFDPISQHEYYSLAAFFNSIDEDGKAGGRAKPYLQYTSSRVQQQIDRILPFVEQRKEEEQAALKIAETSFNSWLKDEMANQSAEYTTWITVVPALVESAEGTLFDVANDGTITTSGPDLHHDDYRVELEVSESLTRVTGWRLEVLPDPSHANGKFSRFGDGEFEISAVRLLHKRAGSPAEDQIEISTAIANYKSGAKDLAAGQSVKIPEAINDDARFGWTTRGAKSIEPHFGVFELDEILHVEPGERIVFVIQQRSTKGHASLAKFRIAVTQEPGETVQRIDGGSPLSDFYASQRSSSDGINPKLRDRLLKQYLLADEAYQSARRNLTNAERQLQSLREQAKPRRVMVLKQREKPRTTHVLERGVWDAKGDVVGTGFLAAVLERSSEETATRLDLAEWIVDRENPLTARVVVNQLWQVVFGGGLVRTPDDFGLQGQLPTHPDLLDWLAVEFMESGWDVRHILRLMVTSETFRQSSVVTTEMLELDPKNELLARAPRYRLPAWMLRDNALKVSGLLNNTIGGPPIYPYQPAGVWNENTMGRFTYRITVGPEQYRRTVYAFWRRSSAPTFLFDTAQRRVCEVRVRRTNTPLHALTLMNDATMLEASRALADLAFERSDFATGANSLSRRILSRNLATDEVAKLMKVHADSLTYFSQHSREAKKYTAVGQVVAPDAESAAQVAAWMTVANLMLNLDEAISHE